MPSAHVYVMLYRWLTPPLVEVTGLGVLVQSYERSHKSLSRRPVGQQPSKRAG